MKPYCFHICLVLFSLSVLVYLAIGNVQGVPRRMPDGLVPAQFVAEYLNSTLAPSGESVEVSDAKAATADSGDSASEKEEDEEGKKDGDDDDDDDEGILSLTNCSCGCCFLLHMSFRSPLYVLVLHWLPVKH